MIYRALQRSAPTNVSVVPTVYVMGCVGSHPSATPGTLTWIASSIYTSHRNVCNAGSHWCIALHQQGEHEFAYGWIIRRYLLAGRTSLRKAWRSLSYISLQVCVNSAINNQSLSEPDLMLTMQKWAKTTPRSDSSGGRDDRSTVTKLNPPLYGHRLDRISFLVMAAFDLGMWVFVNAKTISKKWMGNQWL